MAVRSFPRVCIGCTVFNWSCGALTDNLPTQQDLNTSKALRLAGQSIFLSINLLLAFSIARTFRLAIQEIGYVHNTLKLLAVAWPFLVVRGVFGILQGQLVSLGR